MAISSAFASFSIIVIDILRSPFSIEGKYVRSISAKLASFS